MSNIKVEKGIPLPPTNAGKPMYPWAECEVGDSFFVTGVKAPTLAGSLNHQYQRYGRKFAIRKVEGGLRIWRVS